MLIVLNDIAFQYRFPDKFIAIHKLKELAELILELKKNDASFRISSNYKMAETELAKDYCFSQLFHESPALLDRKYQTVLLTFLTKCRGIVTDDSEVKYADVYSRQCAYAYKNKGSILSLQTKVEFSEAYIKCDYLAEGKHNPEICTEVIIRNLAVKEHVTVHRHELPVRKYESSPKHKINYGWGNEMDLSDEIAQMVLNKAMIANSDPKHLIAKYKGEYYSFRCHYDIYYHGYKDAAMPQNLKNKLDNQEVEYL